MTAGAALEVDVSWGPPAARRGGPGFRLDLSIGLGAECGVLFGASGAGKSTALRLIAGLARPASGRIRLGGEVLFDAATGVDLPLRRRRVGLIFQDDLLFPHLDVAGNVGFGLKGWARAEARARVDEVAALCGVDHLLGRRPGSLSGGERQRVGLARAIAPRPRLLLCDEPVSALDLAARDRLVDGLRSVQAAEGMPVLYVTHAPAEAIAIGARLFRLDGGRVVDEGPPLDVLARAPGVPIGGIVNRIGAAVARRLDDADETVVALDDGPRLVVPRVDRPEGARVVVRVRSDDILLARGPIAGLSARNVLPGTVDRIVPHGAEAEVLVRTGGLAWVVSLVAPAVGTLGLCAGAAVHMIVKARSCRVSDGEGPGG